MTARECFDGLLVELSKVNAPSMLLQDFNYFFNKAVNQYINKRYNIYDVNQQTTDDLRVLKATTVLKPIKANDNTSLKTALLALGDKSLEWGAGASKIYGGHYYVDLPLDYLHMLNCICVYKVKGGNYKCYDDGDVVLFAAKRLTGDTWSSILNDYYNRPLPLRPYYYINNINTSVDLPTNPKQFDNVLERTSIGTDTNAKQPEVNVIGITVNSKYRTLKDYSLWISEASEFLPDDVYEQDFDVDSMPLSEFLALIKKIKDFKGADMNEYLGTYSYKTLPAKFKNNSNTIELKSNRGKNFNNIEREAGARYGNSSQVRCEIRYGNDSTTFELVGVIIDYIKTPQHIRLTQELVNLTRDTSQVMEFPDPVCIEIINELVHLVMENTADPRLQTHAQVTQSIASPVQQLATNTQPSRRLV